MTFSLQSPAFKQQATIPYQYTCDGVVNKRPALSWKDAPIGTQSYVLIVDDSDAPRGRWIHWLVFNIPAEINQLPEDSLLPEQALVGFNSYGKHTYYGPCPPNGRHRYVFKLYALNTRLTVNSSVTVADIENAMQSHILGEAQLLGFYSRKK